MIKKVLLFLVFLSGLFLGTMVFAEVEITSIMPNTIDDTNLEYIEITNNNSPKVDLTGYKIEDKSGDSFVIKNIILEKNNSHKFYYKTTKIRLNNSNEELRLFDKQGNIIDEVKYSSSKKGEIIFIKELERKIIPGSKFEKYNEKLNKNQTIKKMIFNLIFVIFLFTLIYIFVIKKSDEEAH